MTDPMDAIFPNEDVLPDDYPIYGDYCYVVDGKLYMSDYHGITVRQLKGREGFKEVRRCNIVARQKALGLVKVGE